MLGIRPMLVIDTLAAIAVTHVTHATRQFEPCFHRKVRPRPGVVFTPGPVSTTPLHKGVCACVCMCFGLGSFRH